MPHRHHLHPPRRFAMPGNCFVPVVDDSLWASTFCRFSGSLSNFPLFQYSSPGFRNFSGGMGSDRFPDINCSLFLFLRIRILSHFPTGYCFPNIRCNLSLFLQIHILFRFPMGNTCCMLLFLFLYLLFSSKIFSFAFPLPFWGQNRCECPY